MAEPQLAYLGRKPSPPDEKDWKLEDFIGAPQVVGADPLDAALAVLLASHRTSPDVKPWAQLVTQAIKGNPSPTPTPASSDKVWEIPIVLNQGQTPHCVGFGWADWGNVDANVIQFRDADGNAIYYDCKVIDGEPHQEDGSDVRSGAKVMQNRKRLTNYAFGDIAVCEEWVRTKGAVVVGTDWDNAMFAPDANGFAKPTGGIVGGHCYLWNGVLDSEGAYQFLNSWGNGWGMYGSFKMKKADFTALFANGGEACTAVELPV